MHHASRDSTASVDDLRFNALRAFKRLCVIINYSLLTIHYSLRARASVSYVYTLYTFYTFYTLYTFYTFYTFFTL